MWLLWIIIGACLGFVFCSWVVVGGQSEGFSAAYRKGYNDGLEYGTTGRKSEWNYD